MRFPFGATPAEMVKLAGATNDAPAAGASFVAPASFTISAGVAPNGNLIDHLDFVVDGVVRGNATTSPYSLPVTGILVGDHTLVARAVVSSTVQFPSPPVTITVGAFAGAN